MKAKLIKTEVNYILENDKGVVIASTSLNKEGLSLSIKNCQVIENGYDLDELAEKNTSDCDASGCYPEDYFKIGFQKAIELMDDKKFSEEDVMLGWDAGVMSKSIVFSMEQLEPHRESYQRNLKPASLQQTEWEVEIEMTKEEYTWTPPGEGFEDQAYRDWREVPKLDADGCLILKRV